MLQKGWSNIVLYVFFLFCVEFVKSFAWTQFVQRTKQSIKYTDNTGCHDTQIVTLLFFFSHIQQNKKQILYLEYTMKANIFLKRQN